MSCGNCGSGARACSGGSCSSGGCTKLNVFDWLVDMESPADRFDGIEVKFKGGRKAFFRNVNNLSLHTGDPVVVESSPGHHIGFVSLQGELVRLQMKKKKVKYNDDLNVIYRIAGVRDIEKFEKARAREMTTLYKTREVIQELKLGMKLSDIEYQADNTKATFYYSAEDRVDFRELIKRLASEFSIRIEMRQISLRQEAGRLGGIGSCGRELCCSSWLTDFKSVSTSAARYQNLSLNPSKLSGQCGRLKCCLNYELETYLDALEDIPKVEKFIQTERGKAYLMKTDIFKKMMWFAFPEDNNWYPVDAKRVKEIVALNKSDKKPYSLELDESPEVETGPINSDLKRLDKKLKKKTFVKKSKSGGKGPKNKGQNNQGGNNSPQGKNGGSGNNRNKKKGQNPNGNKNQNQPNNNKNQPNRNKGNQKKEGQPQNKKSGGQPNHKKRRPQKKDASE